MPKIASGGGSIQRLFVHVASLSNLLDAWNEFKEGKTKKEDVMLFEKNLEKNVYALHIALTNKSYIPDPYVSFFVSDPKRRHIHKATVRDRVVHQALVRVIEPLFEKQFIFNSFSARKKKGTHLALGRLYTSIRRVSKNWQQNTFSLKCDVQKFFDSVDHQILLDCLKRRIFDQDCLWLIGVIVGSFEKKQGKGLPLGNVTSQLFGNVYLHEFDRFVKHELHVQEYFRYCDDFVILSDSKEYLQKLEIKITDFLQKELLLKVHPDKIMYRTSKQGIDFVGYVVLPNTIVLRPKTKKRLFRSIQKLGNDLHSVLVVSSYIGVALHSDEKKMQEQLFVLREKILKVC